MLQLEYFPCDKENNDFSPRPSTEQTYFAEMQNISQVRIKICSHIR